MRSDRYKTEPIEEEKIEAQDAYQADDAYQTDVTDQVDQYAADGEEDAETAAEAVAETAEAEPEATTDYAAASDSEEAEAVKGRRARKKGKGKKGDGEVDLSKLKKKELLEIMLRQGEEIDKLRAEIADLKAELEDRDFKINRVGSIAEASLAVTKIFEEAEKAAKIYLENIRRKVQ